MAENSASSEASDNFTNVGHGAQRVILARAIFRWLPSLVWIFTHIDMRSKSSIQIFRLFSALFLLDMSRYSSFERREYNEARGLIFSGDGAIIHPYEAASDFMSILNSDLASLNDELSIIIREYEFNKETEAEERISNAEMHNYFQSEINKKKYDILKKQTEIENHNNKFIKMQYNYRSFLISSQMTSFIVRYVVNEEKPDSFLEEVETRLATGDRIAFKLARLADTNAVGRLGIDGSVLMQRPLWEVPIPSLDQRYLTDFLRGLRAVGLDYEIWADWYDAVLKGGPRYHDAAFARAVNDLDLWQREPAEINAQIKQWLEEERLKFKPREIGRSDTRAADATAKKKPQQRSSSKNSALGQNGTTAKRRRPSQPKTEFGRSVAKNRDGIIEYCDDTVILIDRRIEDLKKSIPNEPAAKDAWDQEIASLDELKAKAEDLKQAVPDFAEGKIPEAVVVAKRNAFVDGIKDWWQKRHVEFCDKAADKAILLVAAGGALLTGGGVGALFGYAGWGMALASGLVGAKSIAGTIKKAMKKAGKSIEDGAG